MEENENKKNARIFYITLAIIMTVIIVLIIVTAIVRSNDNPDDSDSSGDGLLDDDNAQAGLDENSLPTFILPVDSETIQVDFSDTVLVFSPTMEDYRTHLGIDISANLGDEVICVADGVVSNVWEDYSMGKCVSIEHSGNAVSIYRNLDAEVNVVIGQAVKSGDVIGAVGESAMNEIAEEPHLHYELKINGEHVDPKAHLKFPKHEDSSDSEGEDDTSTAGSADTSTVTGTDSGAGNSLVTDTQGN